MTSGPSSPSNPSDESRAYDRPRPGGARVLLVSLAVSVALHVLAVVIYTLLLGEGAPVVEVATPPGDVVRPQGVEVVEIAELPEPEPEAVEEPEEPEPEPEAPQPQPAPAPEVSEPATDEPEAPVRSAAERLRPPDEGDARIWRPVDPSLTELTDEQRARIRVYARLESLADSLLTEEERARAARDWTYRDDQGNRWGVADGKIYLGDMSLPFPFSFSAPPTAEAGQRQWEWDDARRGARDALVEESREERAEAIRERMDAERERTEGESTDSASAGGNGS